jgi:hypothetical protein
MTQENSKILLVYILTILAAIPTFAGIGMLMFIFLGFCHVDPGATSVNCYSSMFIAGIIFIQPILLVFYLPLYYLKKKLYVPALIAAFALFAVVWSQMIRGLPPH